MADRKISELTALTGANTQDTDVLVIVDTSANETKKITLGELENALAERDFSFGNNDKLLFGNNDNAEVYHNGANAFFESNTGDLRIIANEADKDVRIYSDNGSGGITEYFRADGSIGQAQMYYYGSKRLNTTSSGIDVHESDDGSSSGPIVQLIRDSANPADLDFLAAINFRGKNDADEDTTYASILGQITDVTDGTEDGSIRIQARRNGTLRSRVQVNTTNTTFNEDSQDFDFRVESDGNANMFFVDGGNNRVGIRTNQPKAIFDVQAGYDTVANVLSNGSYTATFTSQSSGDSGRAQGILISGTNSATRGTALLSEAQDTGNTAEFIIATSPSAGTPVERVRITSNQTTITATDSNTGFGPYLNLYRNSETPADNDYLGILRFQGKDSNGDTVSYGQVFAQALDVTDGTVDSRFDIQTTVGSSHRSAFNAKNTEIVINDSGIDRNFRVESDTKTSAFLVDGGTGNVSVGTTAHGTHNFRVYENSDKESTIFIENGSATANAATALRMSPSGNNFAIISYPDAGTEDNVTRFQSTASGSSFKFATATTDRMTIHSNGRIDLNGPDYTYANADNNYHIMLEENSHNAYISNINGVMFLGSGGKYYGANLRSLDSGETAYAALGISNDTGVYIQGSAGHTAGQVDAGTITHHLFKTDGEVVFNEASEAEADFRVESDSNSHMLFVDASANKVLIGNNTVTQGHVQHKHIRFSYLQ